MAKKQGGSKKSGAKKYGRQVRKAGRYGSPISLYVRGKITAEQYWKLIK